MSIIAEAEHFEQKNIPLTTTNERILASREVKKIILELNELYKETKDSSIMDLSINWKSAQELILCLSVLKIFHIENFPKSFDEIMILAEFTDNMSIFVEIKF